MSRIHRATKESAENADVSDLFLSLSKMSRLSPDERRHGGNQVERTYDELGPLQSNCCIFCLGDSLNDFLLLGLPNPRTYDCTLLFKTRGCHTDNLLPHYCSYLVFVAADRQTIDLSWSHLDLLCLKNALNLALMLAYAVSCANLL